MCGAIDIVREIDTAVEALVLSFEVLTAAITGRHAAAPRRHAFAAPASIARMLRTSVATEVASRGQARHAGMTRDGPSLQSARHITQERKHLRNARTQRAWLAMRVQRRSQRLRRLAQPAQALIQAASLLSSKRYHQII